MKILIVDNKTIRMDELSSLLQGHHLHIVPYGMATLDEANSYDLVILTGGSSFPIYGNEDKLHNEIKIIRHSTTPVFGICFGFELIHVAHGGVLEYHKVLIDGVRSIVFENGKTIEVYEHHRWLVKKSLPEFIELASSDTGVEAMRHKVRSLVGVQFHPEMLRVETSGDTFFKTIIDELVHDQRI